jgi:ABC-type phosphate/phosphonate transport system substrate-binding protein
MYDFPEVRDATDAFWAAIAQNLGLGISLTREADWMLPWARQDLVFSQTCGYPFTHAFRGRLKLVATPHYEADGCEGPRYCSILFAKDQKPLEDFRGSTAAFNNRDSMSGMLALQLVFAPLAKNGRFFRNAVETGSHLTSLAAVAIGEAELCAIDCVTVAYMNRYRPSALAGLVEVGRSPMVPALPFVTVSGDIPKLQQALSLVFKDEGLQPERKALLLRGYSCLQSDNYEEILALEAEVNSRGGLKLW